MCSCSESVLEDEPEIVFQHPDGAVAEWGYDEWHGSEDKDYAIIGVSLRRGNYGIRPRIAFTVREINCRCGSDGCS